MIKGDIVYLRPILKDDLVFLNTWRNNEEIFKNLGGGFLPISIDQQEKWMESLIDNTGNNKRFMICNYESTPVGMVGLYSINWTHRASEIGIFVGDENQQKKGYGKEACKLIEGFAKKYLNIRKIKLSVVSDNVKAIQMWQSLGYKEAGVLKEDRFIEGQYKDVVLMEKFI